MVQNEINSLLFLVNSDRLSKVRHFLIQGIDVVLCSPLLIITSAMPVNYKTICNFNK